MRTPIYTMEFRPVGFATLPRGVITEWVRLPKLEAHTMRRAFPNTEVSEHMFGEFTTSRPLTDDEMTSYQVRQVNARTDPPTGTILDTEDFAAVDDDGLRIVPLTDAGRERLASHWRARGAALDEIAMILAGQWTYATVFEFVDTWDSLTNCHRI